MVVPVQYPYDLYALAKNESSYDPATGDYTSDAENWVFLGKCRDEMNGRGANIITPDGEVYRYGAVVYTPLSTELPTNGQKIKVVSGDEVRIMKEVVTARKDQLHKRVWV